VPRLWTETIEEHRREVRGAILDATWDLVTAHGSTAVTMSQVAERAGIGRATLYKYFPDVSAILLAWHEQHVAAHLEHLLVVRDQQSDPWERLAAVLGEYAVIAHRRGQSGAELSTLLHRGEHVGQAQERLYAMVTDLLVDCASAGVVRDDAAPGELASYCLAALAAAGGLPPGATAERLVAVTLDGLRPPARRVPGK
jgi:AcrR family transcriptional regulator